MITAPTDPATAVATIRRAAAAMRDEAASMRAHIDTGRLVECNDHADSDHDGRYQHALKSDRSVAGRYAAQFPPGHADLVADVLDALADDAYLSGGRWFGRTPPEWTAAYNLAVAVLERRPD